MSQPIYTRATGVVWRVGPDRVLLHRSGVEPDAAAIELTGLVAYAWIALDEPATIAQIVDRLNEVAPRDSTVSGGTDSGPSGEASNDTIASSEAMARDVQRLVDVGVVELIGAGGDDG